MEGTSGFHHAVNKFNFDFTHFFSDFQDCIYFNKFDQDSLKFAFDYFSQDQNRIFDQFEAFSKDYNDFTPFFTSTFYQFFGQSFDKFFSDFHLFFTEFKANQSNFAEWKQYQGDFAVFFDGFKRFFAAFDSFVAKWGDFESTGFAIRYNDFKNEFFEFEKFFK